MALLRQILLCADMRDGACWCYDEVQAWDPGDLQWLLDLGLLREGPVARDIYLWECDAQEVFEPQWLTHPTTGERIGLCACDTCETVHKVRPERMRTWLTTFSQVAAVLARSAGLDGEPAVLMHDHVARLGSIEHERGSYEVYVVRGLRWRPGLGAECLRLREAPRAIVLSLGFAPEAHTWAPGWQSVLNAGEHLRLEGGQLRLPIPVASKPSAAEAEILLTQQERDVLDALAQRPNEPLLTVELEQAAGYSRHTIVDAVRRLKAMRMIERPGGGRRKGVLLTALGKQKVSPSHQVPAEPNRSLAKQIRN